MKTILHITYILLFLVFGTICSYAQPKQQFRVESFGLDQFDMTARNEAFKEVDGNGSLYAIIKVTSSTPNDDLLAYYFNFGNMNSKVKMKDGELWVYVQRNAKMVTISRNGYETINKYDLQTTIEEGRTYTMRLSTQAAKVYTQMVLFKVSPADSKAMITIRDDASETDEPLGITDNEGMLGKGLKLGTYTYRVLAEGYKPSEGRFTLSEPLKRHEEPIVLQPRFSVITLQVNSDADIYVNGELKGRRKWQGRLNPGSYQVECRKEYHKSTSQAIEVEENASRTITLQAPEPIVGMLSVMSSPLDATILIDGKEYGTTPQIIGNLLIGPHKLTLRKSGYDDITQTITVKEGETLETSLALNAIKKPVTTPSTSVVNSSSTPVVNRGSTSDGSQYPDIQTFTVTGNGKTVTFKMIKVEAGSFQMGSNSGDSDEKPVHWVTLSKDYYLGETEVTQDLWIAIMGNNPSYHKGGNHPVENLCYYDCKEFIRKLNGKTGKKFRLPTEAEWEYAAKGGYHSKGYTYAGSNNINDVAWYYGNCGRQLLDESEWKSENLSTYYCKTHPVAQKQPNELGLYDMSGNVFEWCYDWYDSNYYSTSAQTDPIGPSSGSRRVYRGGGWSHTAMSSRLANRGCSEPTEGFFSYGLRLALSVGDGNSNGASSSGNTSYNNSAIKNQNDKGSDADVYSVVEQNPSFPGGEAAMRQFVSRTMKYPPLAQENGIQGRVILSFVVEKDGSIGDIQVVKSPDPSLSKEAIRVVQAMPKWTPGKQNGKAVRVRFSTTLNFKLN